MHIWNNLAYSSFLNRHVCKYALPEKRLICKLGCNWPNCQFIGNQQNNL